MALFDFDDIQSWGPSLLSSLSDIVGPDPASVLRDRSPEYMEDAAEILFSEICSKRSFVLAVFGWLEVQSVVAYHGTRVDDSEADSIRLHGLRILSSESRRECLIKRLAAHSGWAIAKTKLDQTLNHLGASNGAGRREGTVHATVSRAGLVNGFNHYLRLGSEFDQHAAYLLVGEDYKELLRSYGQATLVTLTIPGRIALEAANPYPELTPGMPNLVSEIATSWSYWLANPDFSLPAQETDCGLVFHSDIDPAWIRSIGQIDIS